MAIMEAQTSPSPPFSTEGLGLCELSYIHSCESSLVLGTIFGYDHRWVFWSTCGNDEGRCGKPHHPSATADGALIKDQIISLLELVTKTERCLVQFWGLVTNGDKTCLTTRDQPFALKFYQFNGGDPNGRDVNGRGVKELCEYRKHCLEYLIPVDEDDDDHEIGPPGRVFCSGLPEYARNVADYTSIEYPQRDYAVGRVVAYWALPIYHHPTRHLPIGVLEIVSPRDFCRLPQCEVLKKLQNLAREVNLTTTCVSLLVEVNSCQDGEIAIIDQALSKVRKICELDDTDIWTTSGEILSSCEGVDFIRKGQGVVGRAFSSKSACFCWDVSQLSITKYPLVVQARNHMYSACFAVCLQSSCSSNCIYVLEFFLPMYEEDEDEEDPRTLLNSIMETLKEHLGSSFKIASGQELGQKLTVEVIKVSPEDEFDSFEICSTTGIESTPRLGEVQGGEGMNGVHGQQSEIVGSPPRPEHVLGSVNTSYQASMAVQFNASNLAGADAANNSMNGTYEQENGIVGSLPTQELPQNRENIAHDEVNTENDVANPERVGAGIEQSGNKVINIKRQKSSCTLKSELGITLEVLEQNSSRNLEDAAKALGVSRSTLKRICREYGIRRWPPRKARKVNPTFVEQRVVQPSTESIEEHHRPDATRPEDDSSIWEGLLKFATTRPEDESSIREKLEKFLGI